MVKYILKKKHFWISKFKEIKTANISFKLINYKDLKI